MERRSAMFVAVDLAVAAPAWAADGTAGDSGMPQATAAEHKGIRAQLDKAAASGGETGEAATAQVLHPHFVAEEKFALPPLGLLPALAEGNMDLSMQGEVPMAMRLRADQHQVLKEHAQMRGAVDKMIAAARQEQKTEYVQLGEQLKAHAALEEQVLYPAAILVGDYVQLPLGQ